MTIQRAGNKIVRPVPEVDTVVYENEGYVVTIYDDATYGVYNKKTGVRESTLGAFWLVKQLADSLNLSLEYQAVPEQLKFDLGKITKQ